MEKQYGPFFATIKPVTANIAYEAQSEYEHQQLEPERFIDENPGCLSPKVVLDKCGRSHGYGKADQACQGELG